MTAKERKAKVYHADLWGLRETKYKWLEQHAWISTKWQKVHPKSEFHLFVPQKGGSSELWMRSAKITDIFPVRNTGMRTHRDSFVFDFDRETLERRIRLFLNPDLPDDVVRETYKLKDNRDWKMEEKRRLLQQDKMWKKKLLPCSYRLFDTRWLFYHYHAIDFGREELMRHMFQDNLALMTCRQTIQSPWAHAMVSDKITDDCMVSNRTRERGYLMPLYLYDTSKEDLFKNNVAHSARKANVSSNVLLALEAAYEKQPTPTDIFSYVYSVLYSNVYRENHAELLRLDFPRIPFTKDVKLFQKLAALGERLVDLHLLRSSELDPPIARFQGEGDNRVQIGKKGLRYDSEKQWVYINEAQFFEDVPPEVWEYQIGGYQVCRKWLKDRKGRTLSLDEIKTYCRIVTALEKTIEAQAKIDKLYPKVEETLLPIKL